jgi:hypothetical protein
VKGLQFFAFATLSFVGFDYEKVGVHLKDLKTGTAALRHHV